MPAVWKDRTNIISRHSTCSASSAANASRIIDAPSRIAAAGQGVTAATADRELDEEPCYKARNGSIRYFSCPSIDPCTEGIKLSKALVQITT